MDPMKKRRATYQDLLDAPEHMVAEILGGELRLSNRPAGPAIAVGSRVGREECVVSPVAPCKLDDVGFRPKCRIASARPGRPERRCGPNGL
jgi:hypothetical protein